MSASEARGLGRPPEARFVTGSPSRVSALRRAVPSAVAVVQQSLNELRAAALADVDPEIADLLGRELDRQRGQIELIASENFTWPAVLEAVGSVPTNKYAEGYPGKRYYGGCEVVDEIEQLAIDRAKALFGAEHANVQPHAGAQTNMAVYFACLEPGDTILSLELAHGGHLTHGLKVNFSGRLYTIVHYGVSRETNMVDYDEVLAIAKQHAAEADRLRRLGLPAHGRGRPLPRDRRRGRRAAPLRHGPLRRARRRRPPPEPGAALRLRHLDDAQDARRAALGLRALPRGACRQAVDRAVFPGHAGRAARAHDRGEGDVLQDRRLGAVPRVPDARCARTPTALAETLEQGGLDVLTGGTDTHLLQVDLRRTDWTGKDAEERLDEVKITVNRNTVPFDERPPTVASGVRIGTPAATMRGFDEDDFEEVGRVICEALGPDPDLPALAARSAALCDKRPLYPGFRGWTSYEA